MSPQEFRKALKEKNWYKHTEKLQVTGYGIGFDNQDLGLGDLAQILPKMVNLQSFKPCDIAPDQFWSGVQELPRLTYLSLSSPQSFQTGLPSLTRLALDDISQLTGPLPPMACLQSLTVLGRSSISDEAYFLDFSEFPALHTLFISGSGGFSGKGFRGTSATLLRASLHGIHAVDALFECFASIVTSLCLYTSDANDKREVKADFPALKALETDPRSPKLLQYASLPALSHLHVKMSAHDNDQPFIYLRKPIEQTVENIWFEATNKESRPCPDEWFQPLLAAKKLQRLEITGAVLPDGFRNNFNTSSISNTGTIRDSVRTTRSMRL